MGEDYRRGRLPFRNTSRSACLTSQLSGSRQQVAAQLGHNVWPNFALTSERQTDPVTQG